ncbi:MAG: hypothetical protein IJX72_05220 [Clostridia bacterium]|nr:hypothetical protein [Clostridia bacterium]
MKKNMYVMIAVLLALLLLLPACGEYNPAVMNPGNTPSNGEETTDSPVVTDEEGNVDENPFTVTLTYNGEVYIPSEETPISVQWNDGFSIHTAEIGPDGVARVGGLDGDYRVRLTAIPDGYTYNPNAYVATNNDRNVEIELHKIVTTRGMGDQLYNSIQIKNTGLYCVELTSATHEVFFEFAPPESGTYSVEAWMDTIDNKVNPQARYYGANAFFKQLQFVADDGGAEGTYTKNFKLDVEIADEMISDSGQVTFSFGILATSTDNVYPIKVYFAITLDGEFSLNHTEAQMMYPSDVHLERAAEYDKSKYEFVGAEFTQTVGNNTANVFDGDNYKLWPISEGGDNYYHLYDEQKYPETHGYGPVLYAYVSEACRFMDASFTTVEMRGNKALTVSKGTENYKLFIEGFGGLIVDPPGDNGPYFCVTNCPCRLEGTCESYDPTIVEEKYGNAVGACTDACTKCHVDCRRCPAEAMGKPGYADCVNSDGVHAVTEELKQFLQKYSVNQLLFMDGNGFVETNPTVSVYALEEDQWLFACGYYREK